MTLSLEPATYGRLIPVLNKEDGLVDVFQKTFKQDYEQNEDFPDDIPLNIVYDDELKCWRLADPVAVLKEEASGYFKTLENINVKDDLLEKVISEHCGKNVYIEHINK